MSELLIDASKPKGIADGFNNYFLDIGSGLASKINVSAVSYQNYLPECFNSSIILEPMRESEIKKITNQLKGGAAGNFRKYWQQREGYSYYITFLPNILNVYLKWLRMHLHAKQIYNWRRVFSPVEPRIIMLFLYTKHKTQCYIIIMSLSLLTVFSK